MTSLRARELGVAALLGGVACAACALVAGCLLTSDLEGLAGPAVADDGGEASVIDARADGDVTDAGGDATFDGAVVTDAAYDGAVSPCLVPHAFCRDFDDGNLQDGWDELAQTGGGSLTFDTNALSRPRSLRAIHVRKTDTGATYQSARVRVATSWRRTVFQGDVYVEEPSWQPGDVNIAFVALGFYSASGNSGTVLFQNATEAVTTIESLPTADPARYLDVPAVPYGRWSHVLIDFDPAGSIAYELDGVRVTRSFTAAVAGAGAQVRLEIGSINFNSPVPAVDIRWDNVTVDLP